MLDQMANEIKLISGTSHPELSAKVASRYAPPTSPNCRVCGSGSMQLT